jgi:murein DD-endopeptidase MepM/ murein hydrolase activator NlpD
MFIDDVTHELDIEEYYWEGYVDRQPEERGRFDALTLVAIVLIVFMISKVLIDKTRSTPETSQAPESFIEVVDHNAIAVPYDNYVITQGPHGESYGHLAIDLAAGENSIIKSPINGEVSDLFVDEYGNPTLVIANEIYEVTMLHGEYSVMIGDKINLGQPVGYESNLGYTTDMQGRSCKNRNCGYHTHLNIFDKQLNTNVNPIEILELR